MPSVGGARKKCGSGGGEDRGRHDVFLHDAATERGAAPGVRPGAGGGHRGRDGGDARAVHQCCAGRIRAATISEIRQPAARYPATACHEPPAKLTSATAMNGVKPPPTTLANW